MNTKALRALFATAAMLVALATAGVGTAAAAPASWNPVNPGTLTMRGDMTLRQTTRTVNCPNFTWTVNASTSGGGFMGHAQTNQCSGSGLSGPFTMWPIGQGVSNLGSYALSFSGVSGIGYGGVFGFFFGANFQVPFANGNATTPSQIAFSNTHIGSGVYATGTLRVTRASGGLVTLN